MPNFLIRGADGVTQALYFLRNFLPLNPSGRSQEFFECAVDRLERVLDGKYVTEKLCLSPFSDANEVKHLAEAPYSIADLKAATDPSRQDELDSFYETRSIEAHDKAALATAAIKRSKTIKAILAAIKELKAAKEPITQAKVGELCGKSRRTVIRNWKDEDIQSALRGGNESCPE